MKGLLLVRLAVELPLLMLRTVVEAVLVEISRSRGAVGMLAVASADAPAAAAAAAARLLLLPLLLLLLPRGSRGGGGGDDDKGGSLGVEVTIWCV